MSEDAALVRNTLTQILEPVVVVGHSYGGAVMSEATAGLTNVHALVYVPAFALDAGESLGERTRRRSSSTRATPLSSRIHAMWPVSSSVLRAPKRRRLHLIDARQAR
jgi:pimeloyl-ACP methyl ester carboxylesterase